MQKWTESPFGVLEAHFLSPSLLPSHSVSITHSFFSPHLLFPLLLFISIALLSQPWLSHSPGVAPLIFHIPLFLLFGLFPKSTLSQRGEAFSHWLLLHGNFSLFCASFSFFRKSFFLSFNFVFVHPWLSLLPLTMSFSLSFLFYSYCPWSVFFLGVLSFTHLKIPGIIIMCWPFMYHTWCIVYKTCPMVSKICNILY